MRFKEILIKIFLISQLIHLCYQSETRTITFLKTHRSRVNNIRHEQQLGDIRHKEQVSQGVGCNSWVCSEQGKLLGFLGVCIIIAGLTIAWLFERRYVIVSRIYEKAEQRCLSLDEPQLYAANEGRLMHVVGQVETTEITDNELDLQVQKCLRLRRQVEMLQWVEKNGKYIKEWNQEWIDSMRFLDKKRINPLQESFIVKGKEFYPGTITIGEFTIEKFNINNMKREKKVKLREGFLEFLPVEALRKISQYYEEHHASIKDDYLYLQYEIDSESIGDLRVSYYTIEADISTFMGRQSKNCLQEYYCDINGRPVDNDPSYDRADDHGYNEKIAEYIGFFFKIFEPLVCWAISKKYRKPDISIFVNHHGLLTVSTIFSKLKGEAANGPWNSRTTGLLFTFSGFILLLQTYRTFFIQRTILGFDNFIINLAHVFILAFALVLITVKLAWISYKPWTSILPILVSAAVFILLLS